MSGFKCFVGLVFIFTATLIHGAHSTRVSYGGSCNRTARCDTRAWLRCIDGVCDCMKQEEMIFDTVSGKCLAKAGERCKYALGESETAAGSYLFEMHSCVNNASCSADGMCNCNPGFYETADGNCSASKLQGEACNEDVKCSTIKGLECRGGICECDPTKSEYSNAQSQCVGLAGSQCIGSKCTEHASCSTNMCVCNEEFYWDATGKCAPKIAIFRNCSADFQCKKLDTVQLKCVQGVCNCDPATSVHASVKQSHHCNYQGNGFSGYEGDFSTPQCVPLAGLPCKNRLCAPRSYCVFGHDNGCQPRYHYGYNQYKSDDDYSGTCTCETGLTQSKNNRCGSGFRGACSSGDECISSLVCNNKKCTCEMDIQEFDSNRKTCFSKAGGPCTENSDCASDAHCHVPDSGTTGGRGHCKCNQGLVPNANGVCEAAAGTACEDTADCDSIARLECINNVCRCGKFAVFNDTNRKCVGKVGASCKLDTGNECVENALCSEVHPKLPGSCICAKGYVETSDYTCIASELFDAAVDESDLDESPEH